MWLASLQNDLSRVSEKWSLTLGTPFDGDEVTCSWVAPVILRDGSEGILKIGMPHFEALHEGEALRFLDGNPTVRLLGQDVETGALLMERCKPGHSLQRLPENEQDDILAPLMKRFWRDVPVELPFRALDEMVDYWVNETIQATDAWFDAGLVQEGLDVFQSLSSSEPRTVLLATDLHAGNVLKGQRESWLVIDPKPFVGDPAYDATQHLFNCRRLIEKPDATIRRFADLLEVDAERVRMWLFARAAAEPRNNWADTYMLEIAKRVAP